MSDDRLAIFEELERNSTPTTRDTVQRAPFNYPGGKSRSVNQILPHLPLKRIYVEPFGGSGVVMLNRVESPLEVFNDIYSGVVCFYRCLRDSDKMHRLCELLDLTIHSREEWIWCKQTWEQESEDVERAFKWYYMISYSFGGLSRNFGRSTSWKGGIAGKLRNRIKEFNIIHQRVKNIQFECQDWEQCVRDYDSEYTVFYLDPPYVDADAGIYKDKMTQDAHRHLLDVVFSLKGFVAISGYPNPLYDEQLWDAVESWDSFVSIQSLAYQKTSGKEHLRGLEERKNAVERLWIKY